MLRSHCHLALTGLALCTSSVALAQTDCTWGLAAANGPVGQVKMCEDLNTGKIVLYKGVAEQHTWEWNGETWSSLTVDGPPLRGGAAMAPFIAAPGEPACIIMFGGGLTSPSVYYNDTWKWDGQSWSQVASTGPSPRSNAAMTFDSARNRIVLFGGVTGVGEQGWVSLGETWEWDGVAWTQVQSAGPLERWGATMHYDPNSQMAVLFGGVKYDFNGSSQSDEWDPQTWGWDGNTWTVLAPDGPPIRYRAQMSRDPVSDDLVLFSGWYAGILNDTWTWDGKTWKEAQESISTPPPRTDAGFAVDVNQRLLLTGGRDFGQNIDFTDSHHYAHCTVPSNNKCQNASIGLPGSYPFTTNGAGILYDQTTLNCERASSINITADIWYLVPAQCTGTMTISLCDADFDSVLAVYAPNCGAVANGPIACGDNECGDDALVVLPVQYGDAFLVRVAGANGTSGSGTMVITCTNACPADVTGDSLVNVDDLLAVINSWGACPAVGECPTDIAPIGGNGIVDVDDLLVVINAWGECP